MYKGTSENMNFRRRIASHATKGDPTRGVVGSSNHAPAATPTSTEVTLVELKDRRASLIRQKVGLYGPARTKNDAQLAAVNIRIKELNKEAADRDVLKSLYDAINSVIKDEAVVRDILDEARRIRIAKEMHEA